MHIYNIFGGLEPETRVIGEKSYYMGPLPLHNKNRNPSSSPEGLYAENALQVLVEEMEGIRSVEEWARMAGCSRGTLYRVIRQQFDMTPGELLRKNRYECIMAVLRKYPDSTSEYVACKTGLETPQRLYKFLSRWHDTTFTELRYAVLAERRKRLIDPDVIGD